MLRLAREIEQDLSTIRVIAHSKFRQEYEKFVHLAKYNYPRACSQFGSQLNIDKQIHAGIGKRYFR